MSSSSDTKEEPTLTYSSESASKDISVFKMHIAHNCPEAPSEVQLFYVKQLTNNDEIQKSTKKQKVDIKNKDSIFNYVKNQELSLKGKNN
ncbi:32361_t:CDS:2 [Gigaspora margarita]|uniref:32361_t:CDS:1 n=1 Tax=Gigaspora margarita TaxID=4874 RepID=A0ABN7W2E3_GIGMA|nr:32361_t:CDS:2 [Gigaspora margarita]